MSATLGRAGGMGEQQDVYSRVTNKIIGDLEKGRADLATTMAGGTCGGADHKALAAQWRAVQGHQRSDALGLVFGERLCRADLDDVQASR